MVQCPACRISHVANTVFCPECGLYLLEREEISTDPLETETQRDEPSVTHNASLHGTGLLTIRLRICASKPSETTSTSRSPFRFSRSRSARGSGVLHDDQYRKNGTRTRELEVPLTKPIRLGRIDPKEGVYPDVDLTTDLAMEHGVSREHACIFRRGNAVEVEDLASTNGTMLNGTRLAPYLPVTIKDGDQLQLGKLLIEVSFRSSYSRHTTTETRIASAAAH
jgi:hypothetical protein